MQVRLIILSPFGDALKPPEHLSEIQLRSMKLGEACPPIHWMMVGSSSGISVQTVGIHQVCEGPLIIRMISETHRAITCPLCQFRVPIPVHVQTYGDLWKYAEASLKKKERRAIA